MHTDTEKREPGKFEVCESQLIGRILYEQLGNGLADEELGDVQDFGYYALFKGKRFSFITEENNFGFFYYTCGMHEKMRKKWGQIEETYEEFMDDCEDTESDQP